MATILRSVRGVGVTESLKVTVLHRVLSQVVDVVSMLYIVTHFLGFLIHVYIFIRHSCAEVIVSSVTLNLEVLAEYVDY